MRSSFTCRASVSTTICVMAGPGPFNLAFCRWGSNGAVAQVEPEAQLGGVQGDGRELGRGAEGHVAGPRQ